MSILTLVMYSQTVCGWIISDLYIINQFSKQVYTGSFIENVADFYLHSCPVKKHTIQWWWFQWPNDSQLWTIEQTFLKQPLHSAVMECCVCECESGGRVWEITQEFAITCAALSFWKTREREEKNTFLKCKKTKEKEEKKTD